MKFKERLKTSLTKEVEGKLNEQIKLEEHSSQFYLSCASWCEKEGYQNAAEFLYGHSEEERIHMLKVFKYVNSVGGHALVPDVTGIKSSFSSLREVFEEILEHEINVTKSIGDLADYCFKLKDFSSFQFLQWFVQEQREEEELARRVIEVFNLIDENSAHGLWYIDKEIGRIGVEANDSTSPA